MPRAWGLRSRLYDQLSGLPVTSGNLGSFWERNPQTMPNKPANLADPLLAEETLILASILESGHWLVLVPRSSAYCRIKAPGSSPCSRRETNTGLLERKPTPEGKRSLGSWQEGGCPLPVRAHGALRNTSFPRNKAPGGHERWRGSSIPSKHVRLCIQKGAKGPEGQLCGLECKLYRHGV